MKSQANYNLVLCLLEEIGKSVVDSIRHLNKHWSRKSQTLTDQSKQTSISMCRFQYSIVKFITQTRGQGSLNVKVQVVYVTEEVFAPQKNIDDCECEKNTVKTKDHAKAITITLKSFFITTNLKHTHQSMDDTQRQQIISA